MSIRDVDHTLELVVTTAGNIIIAAINATGIIVKILGEVKSVTEHVADTVAALIEFLEAEPLKTLIQLSNGGVGYVGTAGAIIQSLRAFVP